MIAKDISTYNLPDDMKPESVTQGLIELVRPCAPDIVKYLVRLQACKPFFEVDEERQQIIFDCLYDDLKDYPEVAVVIGLEDCRKSKGKYFPSIEEIVSAVQWHRDNIFEALEYFNHE